MTTSFKPEVKLRYEYRHFQTDGKLENVYEALDEVEAERVCLSVASEILDGPMLDKEKLSKRMERVNTVVKKMNRRGYACELILAGPGGKRLDNNSYKQYIRKLYSLAGQVKAKVVWVDDSEASHRKKISRRQLLNWFQMVRRAVHKVNPRMRLGLMAGLPEYYAKGGTTADEIAKVLAGTGRPLLAQSQGVGTDYDRRRILDSVQATAVSKALAKDKANIEWQGIIENYQADGFHKSVEATQMQINLNMLYGAKGIVLDCFDRVGSATDNENLYLQMHQNNKRLRQKLAKFCADEVQYGGIRIVVPDGGKGKIYPEDESFDNCWASILWRMGLPVDFICSSNISKKDTTNTVYVLTGQTPKQLTRRQLDHIFSHGVIVDAKAAETIEKMGLPGLIGTRVGGPITNVQTEILSDQTFAAPYYGHQTLWNGVLESEDFRRLRPWHQNARFITSLARKGQLPNTNGIILFDNVEHHHRCAILPYILKRNNHDPILTSKRQRHLRDIISWLLRGRLPCYIENTPDLVPFHLTIPGRRRIILALLNTGFDWAIDARIRLGNLPFAVKRVRELNEQGQYETPDHLQPIICGGYQYIQLTSETAVPPMQMTILLIEG